MTAANFALTKYANKTESNGTDQNVEWFLAQIKRGSKKFRKTLDMKFPVSNISDLRVVNSFFNLIGCEKPESIL
ncbi:MAG: hypothetical protein ACK559_38800, partial [bacterium]